MRRILITITLTAFLALPAGALARPHHPGNAAGDEYSENVPGPGGDKPSGNVGGGGSGGSLPPGTVEALQEQGSAGAGAANFANATATAAMVPV